MRIGSQTLKLSTRPRTQVTNLAATVGKKAAAAVKNPMIIVQEIVNLEAINPMNRLDREVSFHLKYFDRGNPHLDRLSKFLT